MAEPITTFITKVLTTFGASKAAAGSVAAFLTGKTFLTIASLAISTAIQKRQLKGLQDNVDLKRDVLIRSATEAKKIVYGKTLVGGVVVYSNVAGTKNSSLFIVVAHAGHIVESITDIWLDDNVVAEADNPWYLGTGVTGGRYYVGSPPNEGVAAFSRYLGTAGQGADPVLESTFADWTTAHRGRGVAYTAAQLVLKKKSEKVFESGAPQKIRALMEGKKPYDPSADLSPGADMIANGYTSTSFRSYTTNPVRCILDYLIDGSVGYGIDPSRIDWDSVQDEIDACDQQVYNASGNREARFTMNGVLSTFDTHRTNIERMLTSCNGSLFIKDGKYGVRVGRYGFETPTVGAIANGDAALGTTTTVSGNYRITNGASGGGFARGVRAMTTEISKRYFVSAWSVAENGGGAFLLGVSNNSDGSSTFASSSDTWSTEQQFRVEFVATATTTYVVYQNNSATNNAYVDWGLDEHYAVTDVEITGDWLRDGFAVQTQDSDSELFNVAKAFYVSPDESYKNTQALEVTNAALISEYGKELTTEFNLPFTNSEDEAQRLAFKRILKNSDVRTTTLPCNYRALNVAVHDVVMVTIPEVGWSQKTFIVEQVTFVDNYGGVDLLLREVSAESYADPDVANYSLRSPTGAVTWASPEVPDPSSVTLSAPIASVLQIDWNAPEPTEYWDWCEVWRNTVNNSGTATLIYKGKNESYVDSDVTNGTDYYYWVRATKGDEESSFVASSPAFLAPPASGKSDVFVQATPPTANDVNDIWIDTSNGNKIHYWNGASWIEVQDADIAQALSDAATAQSTADGKIESYYQNSQPGTADVGDLWFDTDDGNKVYRYDGATWQSAVDNDIAEAISDAATAQATADGKIVTFFQSTAPTAEGVGDLWYDTDDGTLYRWNGSNWSTQAVATYNTGALADKDTVNTADIDNDAVTNDKVANNAVDTPQVVNAAITDPDVASKAAGTVDVGIGPSATSVLQITADFGADTSKWPDNVQVIGGCNFLSQGSPLCSARVALYTGGTVTGPGNSIQAITVPANNSTSLVTAYMFGAPTTRYQKYDLAGWVSTAASLGDFHYGAAWITILGRKK